MERFTITKTKRWGNADTQITNVFTTNRSQMKRDKVISIANDMMSKEEVYSSLRFGIGRFNTEQDIQIAVKSINGCMKNLGKMSFV